jgi:hypothetical protein
MVCVRVCPLRLTCYRFSARARPMEVLACSTELRRRRLWSSHGISGDPFAVAGDCRLPICAGIGNTAVRVRGAGHVPIASALQCQAEKGDPLDSQVPQCARGLAGNT